MDDYLSYSPTSPREHINPLGSQDPIAPDYSESPCKSCPTYKNRGPLWIAEECLASCSRMNNLKKPKISSSHEKATKKCPFEDCDKLIWEDSECCQKHKSKLHYRRHVMKLPPEIIFLKDLP